MTGGESMKFVVRKVVMLEESNELGSIYLDRLIERLILHSLDLPINMKAQVLSNLSLTEQKHACNERIGLSHDKSSE